MDIRPELEQLKDTIAGATTYGGGQVSGGITKLLVVETREGGGGGILAPPWLSVLERGRGPRRSNTDHGLWKKIYAWMERKNLFRTSTPQGKVNEAKGMTWYINKYGNKQFQTRTFVDVYTTARRTCVEQVIKKYGNEVARITNDIL